MAELDDYAILEMLARNPETYLASTTIAEDAKLSIDGVIAGVTHLERLGVPVESHPAYGYRLPLDFDLIDRSYVAEQLSKRGLSWPVAGLLEVESTNDLANRAAMEGDADGTIYFAEYQSRGRGRLGRRWHSPVGAGLWFSVLRRQNLPMEHGWRVTLGTGIAVAQSISALTGLDPSLKWPNDVHIDGLKVCGILTESRSDHGRLTDSTIGVGVNVHLDASEFPQELRAIATSIHASGAKVRRSDLLVEILDQLNAVSKWSPDRILSAWQARCKQWGKRVRVEQDGEHIEGLAIELAENGAFVIEKDDGDRFAVHAGDVTHLRATL